MSPGGNILFIASLGLLVSTSVFADSQRVQFYKCFAGSHSVFIDGRVIEQTNSTIATRTDNAFSNIVRKMKQLFNEEQANVRIALVLNNKVWAIESDDEGYFSLVIDRPEQMMAGFHRLTALIAGDERAVCDVAVFPNENTIGIISDFDDTVIVSNVNEKDQLLVNSFARNYLQREMVPGLSTFINALADENPIPEFAPVFFVTGSPRQIQEGITQFLDLHQFPKRIIITKKISGDDRDPLLDQFDYKVDKIETLMSLFPQMRFYLIGDDGEKDPEVYNAIREKYPDRVLKTWIHQVNHNQSRVRFAHQTLFNDNPHQ